MKRIYIIALLCGCILPIFAQSVRLSKGTTVAVMVTESMTSRSKNPTPTVVVSGDIYDDSGNYVIIKARTAVTVQINSRKGNAWGEVGRIEIIPISTKAVNGRQIALVAEPVVFKGNEHLFSAGTQARINEGTSFIATIANDYVFNVE